jgi:hypothetical protein
MRAGVGVSPPKMRDTASCQGTVISDNYFCLLATTTSAGGSAVRTACATVPS